MKKRNRMDIKSHFEGENVKYRNTCVCTCTRLAFEKKIEHYSYWTTILIVLILHYLNLEI